MKKHLTIILTMILSLSFMASNAQDEMKYLFSGAENNTSVSGFAAVFNEFSSFDKEFAFSMGGGAALLINQKIFIGGYGMGLTTRHLNDFSWFDSKLERNLDYYDLYTRFGHGGFWLGYIFKPQKAIHFGANVKLGWGSVSITDKKYPGTDYKWENYNIDNVFVITPQLDMNLNLLKWMRLNVGVGYRFVTGLNETYAYLPEGGSAPEDIIQKEYYDKNALNSITGNITLAFGWFNK